MGGAVVHKTAGPRRAVNRFANRGDVCAFAGGFGGLQQETFAEVLVAGCLIEQHFHEFLFVLLVQPRAGVVEGDNGRGVVFEMFLRGRVGCASQPGKRDGDAVFAERTVCAHRATAIEIQFAVADGKRDAIIFSALNRGGQFAGVLNETRHLAGGEVILATLEGTPARELAEGFAGQNIFQFAGRGHENGEATHKEIGAPASGIKIRLAKSPDAPDKDL